MAHRKPIGTTTGRMTFDWDGPSPRLDDYLRSSAGTWYRVAGVEERADPAKVGLVLERAAEPEPHPSAGGLVLDAAGHERAVHPFHWYPRR